MDATTSAGIAVLIFKLAIFALLVQAARRAGHVADEARADRAAREAAAAAADDGAGAGKAAEPTAEAPDAPDSPARRPEAQPA